MRSTEERAAAVRRRAEQLRRRRRARRDRALAAASATACLALIVGLALAMPGIVAGIDGEACGGIETAAAMLSGGTALGYLVMAVLAFALGVCVTVLCFRLRRREQEDGRRSDRREDGDGGTL